MSESQQFIAAIQESKTVKLTPFEAVSKYIYLLPWVIFSVCFCVIIAFITLRYSPKVYKVNGTVQLKDDTQGSSGTEKFEEMLFLQPQQSINDELQIIKSTSLATNVVKSLGLEILYFNKGNIRETLINQFESPIACQIISLEDSSKSINLDIDIINEKVFRLNDAQRDLPFGQIFENDRGKFLITRTKVGLDAFPVARYRINYSSSFSRSKELLSKFTAAESGNADNIVLFSLTTENPKVGISIINQWMAAYQQLGLDDKRGTAISALNFINDQMDTVLVELQRVENRLQRYRENRGVINPEKQSELFFSRSTEIDRGIVEQSVQLQILAGLRKYFKDGKGEFRQVGTTLGILEPSLVTQITEYNKLVLEREGQLKTTTVKNPVVVRLDALISKLRGDIEENLLNIENKVRITLKSFETQLALSKRELSMIPDKEKGLQDINRQQRILEELYSFLLQKKFETSISAASTLSNVKIVESAFFSNVPVSPKKTQTYVIAVFLGLLIPTLVIFLKEYLNDRVNSREDVVKFTQAPIVGEVGHNDEAEVLVASGSSRKFIAEQFRIIRTNMNYLLPKQDRTSFLVTSTTSGEGKTFMSINMAAVFAIAGKKTVLLEFDIRKPRVMSSLGIKSIKGLVNYLIGEATLEDIILPLPKVNNLHVIPCGPIPPNPAELLLSPKLTSLMEGLKKEFDVIVIDTAPVGLVSDSLVLGQFVDASVYVVRHNYTYRKQLQMLDEVYLSNRMPKISVIINDIAATVGYGRYYGYGGYGYGGYGYYGYTYGRIKSGKEYFVESPKTSSFQKVKKRIMRRFFNR